MHRTGRRCFLNHTVWSDGAVTRPDPLATARALVLERFPAALQAWLSGSVVIGGATSTSDLDITVLLEEGQAGRQSLAFLGWPVEVFVHTTTSLRWFVARDVARRRPTMARLVAEGIALLPGNEGDDLRSECAAVLEAGPGPMTPETLTMARYTLTDLLDDLEGCDDPEQLDAIVVEVWRSTAELHLAGNKAWTGSGKWLVRELQHFDESEGTDTTHRLQAGLHAAINGDKGPLAAASQQVLSRVGGRLWIGLEVAAPPAANTG